MSEQYIVSARKYRPQTFDTVVGQEHITTTLKNAIRTGHIAHAYLFCGPRGVGKTTCARILARTINCENPTPEMEACGQCATCVSFQENASFNVFELDAASNNSVDDIRALTEQVRYAPQIGKYKIYIIDEVHMLSSAAFNAFLKTLEEPPPYAIFILATTEKHKILPTILSRCQIFDFKRIATEDIVHHLDGICKKEHTAAENAALHIIAQKSEGCMRDALSMMDRIASFTNGQITYTQTVEHLNILDADVYFKLTDILLSKDIAAALLMTDDIFQKGFEGDVILNGFAEHFRNILLCKDLNMARLLDVPEEHKRIYYEKAQIIPAAYILSAMNILNEAELNYRNALNKRLHIELCMMKLCYLNDMLQIDELAKKKDDAPVIPAGSRKQLASVSQEPASNNISVPQAPGRPSISGQQPYGAPAIQQAQVAEPEPAFREKKPKLGKDLYQAVLSEQLKTDDEGGQIALTEALAQELLKGFIEAARKREQLSVATQLSQMQLELKAPDAIHLNCISSINYHFALHQRDTLLAYFTERTRQHSLQITASIDKSLAQKEPEKKYKSKSEIFDEMAQRNPALQRLKDALNLQIE